jgi:hypothetical protein
MFIRVSEHILSLDENIVAVGLFTKQFHMVESAVRPVFNKRFKLSPATEDSGPAYAAAIYGVTRLMMESFGEVEKITADYNGAKLMLMALNHDAGFIGLVLNKTVNSDYLALRIEIEMNGDPDEIDTLV